MSARDPQAGHFKRSVGIFWIEIRLRLPGCLKTHIHAIVVHAGRARRRNRDRAAMSVAKPAFPSIGNWVKAQMSPMTSSAERVSTRLTIKPVTTAETANSRKKLEPSRPHAALQCEALAWATKSQGRKGRKGRKPLRRQRRAAATAAPIGDVSCRPHARAVSGVSIRSWRTSSEQCGNARGWAWAVSVYS
jgi:hypothetical protein